MRSGHKTLFRMGTIIINCDLGENESDAQTNRMLDRIDAANICCGMHAGSEAKTRRTMQLAAKKGVLIGAHPGLAAAGGRGGELPDADDFRELLQSQLQGFIAFADKIETWVSYVKLHGSLYHAVEVNEALADIYLNILKHTGAGLGVTALAGGAFQKKARQTGLVVREEIFADRGYRADGSLVPRHEAGALLEVDTALSRFEKWLRSGLMDTVEGSAIELRADTICVHADSDGSETLLAGLRNSLTA